MQRIYYNLYRSEMLEEIEQTLSEMGIRTPADLLAMSAKDLDKLKSKRGWGQFSGENTRFCEENFNKT